MIVNHLLLKLQDRTTASVAQTKGILLSMEGRIEVLRKIRVETDIRHGASSYDLMLITGFASMADFDTYLIHPVHQEVSAYVGNVVAAAASVCYES